MTRRTKNSTKKNEAAEQRSAALPNGVPEGAKRVKNRPLALGEVTGHHHSFVADEADVEMYEKDGVLYVHVVGEAPLTHQEHKGHMCPAGSVGEVRIAEEVTDWGTAPVRD